MATQIGGDNTGGGGGGGGAVTSTTVDLTSIGGVNYLTIEVALVLATAWMRYYDKSNRHVPAAALSQPFNISTTNYIAKWLPRPPTLFSALGGGTVPQECGSLVIMNANSNVRVAEICIPYAELGALDGSVKLTNWQALDAVSVFP